MTLKPIMIPANDDEFGTVLNCAVRYCLGRETYMPKLVIDWITPRLNRLTDKTLWCFARDIERAPSLGNDLIDVPAWQEFLQAVKTEQARRAADAEN